MRLSRSVLAAALFVGACVTSRGGGAPDTFVRTTSDARATRTVDVREGLTHPQAMRFLTETLEKRYVIDVVDPRVGFAMTAWRATLVRDGVPDLRYRTRIVARFLGDDWKQLQLRGEANWANGDGWDIGVDAPQLDSTTSELNAKLGAKP